MFNSDLGKCEEKEKKAKAFWGGYNAANHFWRKLRL